MTRIHLLLLVLISSISLFSANGASKFQIGNDIINNLIKFVSKKVIAEANKHKDNLPSLNMDLSPVKFLPIILNLSNIKFEELVYREDELQINVDHSAKNMRIKLNQVNLKASSDYLEKLLIFKKVGSVNLDLDFSLELNINFHVTNDKFLQLTLNSVNVEHNFNKLDIKGDFLLKLIAKEINIFKKVINWGLKKALTPIIDKLINKLNSLLLEHIVVPVLDSSLEIQFLEEPIFNDDYFILDLGLEFFENGQKNKFLQISDEKKMLFEDYNFNLDPEIKDLIQVQLEETLMNDFVSVALKNSRHFNITNDNIPKDIPFKVNTLFLQALIPQMFDKYPNKDLIIYMDIESFPFFSLNSADNSLNVNFNLGISFAILEDPENIILSISSDAIVSLKFDSEKNDNSIHLIINKVELTDLSVIMSVFDISSADEVKKEMNIFFTSFLYFVNNYLRLNPIKIPTFDGISLEKINISIIDDNFLQVKLKPSLI